MLHNVKWCTEQTMNVSDILLLRIALVMLNKKLTYSARGIFRVLRTWTTSFAVSGPCNRCPFSISFSNCSIDCNAKCTFG